MNDEEMINIPGSPIKVEPLDTGATDPSLNNKRVLNAFQRLQSDMSPLERFIEGIRYDSPERAATVGELVEFAHLVQEALHDLEVNSGRGR